MTRARLIEAAEQLFIRKGFDDASVEEISETAGYSRGAFYSSFESKEDIFLAVIDGRRPRVLDDLFGEIAGRAERIAAVREWFSSQWRFKDFVALRMEFSRRAIRDRSVRKHLAELRRRELETYGASVRRFLGEANGVSTDRPEIVALALLAVSHGLGDLAMNTEPEWEHIFTEAARLVFDRMTAFLNSQSQLGELQC